MVAFSRGFDGCDREGLLGRQDQPVPADQREPEMPSANHAPTPSTPDTNTGSSSWKTSVTAAITMVTTAPGDAERRAVGTRESGCCQRSTMKLTACSR